MTTKPEQNPGIPPENNDHQHSPENREDALRKQKEMSQESLKNQTHESLNSLRDSLDHPKDADILENNADWLGKNSSEQQHANNSNNTQRAALQATFETPVDEHVTYVSKNLFYDSLRSTALLGKDTIKDFYLLVRHPVSEITNTYNFWYEKDSHGGEDNKTEVA